MRSQMTFEEIDNHFKTSKVGLIVTFYHWASPDTDNYKYPLRMSDLTSEKGFYVCDDTFSWADPHMVDMAQLYEVDCVIRKPLCLMQQFIDFETVFRDPSPEYSLFLEGEFDAVIYTEHEYGRAVRQCFIRDPVKQVLGIREIDKPDVEEIIRNKANMGKLWDEILLNHN